MFKRSLVVLVITGLLSPHITLAADPNGAMSFTFEQNDFRFMGMGLRQDIYADGVMTPGTVERLLAFLETHHVAPGGMIDFNSPGGSLREGLQIGRLIRQRELQTNVGRLGADGKALSEGASCYSSCSIAFLGGVIRYASRDTSFGVHRFSALQSTLSGPAAIDVSQIQSAEISDYVNSMGVKSSFISEMNVAGPNQMNILSQEKLLALHVLTPLVETTWEIKTTETGDIYILGLTRDVRGAHKVLVGCPPSHMEPFLTFMFEAGDAAKDVVGQTDSIQLRTNDGSIDLRATDIQIPPHVEHSYVVITIFLNSRTIPLIKNARTLGIAMLHRNRMTYVGFDAEFNDSKSKVFSYLHPCIRQ